MVIWYELIISIVYVCALSHVKLLATPCTIAHQAPLWNFPGKNTGAGCQFLLQGIFLTQRLILCHLCLQNWLTDSLPLCHLGSPYVTWIVNISILQMKKPSLRKINNLPKVSKCQHWNSNPVNFRAHMCIEGRAGYITQRIQSIMKKWALCSKGREICH